MRVCQRCHDIDADAIQCERTHEIHAYVEGSKTMECEVCGKNASCIFCDEYQTEIAIREHRKKDIINETNNLPNHD